MSQIDTPNLVVPLAISYNERGIDGTGNTIQSGIDQRKINCMYEPVHNAATGAVTFKVAKRPGVANSSLTVGSASQTPYFVMTAPRSSTLFTPWILSKVSGNNIRASSPSTTTVIFNDANYRPYMHGRTAISGVDTAIVQFTKGDGFAQRVFYSSTIGTWTEITDGDFTGLVHVGKMESMDGYLFTIDASNNIYDSDLNSLANWTPTNFLAKQIQQDVPMGLAQLNGQIIAFGAETAEIFVNAGNPSGSPLARRADLFQRVGLNYQSNSSNTSYYCRIAGFIYFVGAEAGQSVSLGVFAYNGSSMQRVSTPYIDKILTNSFVYCVETFTFSGKIAVALGLSVAGAPQSWLMFFPDMNEWFEWNSTVFGPQNSGGYFLGTGTNTNNLYTVQTSNVWTDDGTSFTETLQFKLPKSDNARSYMGMFGVKGDTARSTSSLTVEFSDDDWQTFYTAGAIDMTQIAKKHIYQCGSYTDRGVRLTHSANVELRLESALARIS